MVDYRLIWVEQGEDYRRHSRDQELRYNDADVVQPL